MSNDVAYFTSIRLQSKKSKCSIHKLCSNTDLSLGLNFSRTSKVSVPDLVAPIEHSFKKSKISPDQLNSLRFLLSNVISTNNCPQKSNLSPSQKSALSELNSARNLIITKADKGGQTVLLNKSDYISHVETMLNSGSYTFLNKDHSTHIS